MKLKPPPSPALRGLAVLVLIWLTGLISAAVVLFTALILCMVNGVEMPPLVRVFVAGGGFIAGVIGFIMYLHEGPNG